MKGDKMTQPQNSSFGSQVATPEIPAPLLAGVRTRRVLAICLDLVLVSLIATALFLILGLLTLGLSWLLLPPLFPIIAFFYNGLSISGPHQATPGMRAAGLQVFNMNGGHVTFLEAALHAVLYYFSMTIFAPVILLSLLTSDKRCLHDMLAGVIVLRRSA
jgi:uncharacterized RDD family membrane protein YckC